MTEPYNWASTLIHLGALLYILGFLVRDELLLRLLVLGGTALYILYYFLFPPTPLWDAIITSVVLGVANIWVLFKIVLERSTFGMSEEEKDLYSAFSTLNPGQFRQILKNATWKTAAGGETLCDEDGSPSHVYYLVSGSATVSKGDNKFPIDSGTFIGEISFILGTNYSATVTAEKGLRYVEWDGEDLHRHMKKGIALSNALGTLFNRDLAGKLAVSHR